MSAISIFLDESGNSGPNYLDPQQPFFICGGWFVFDQNISKVRTVIEKWEKEIKGNHSEIKGNKLAKRASGRKKILQLFKQMGKAGAVPTYSIMEKRFGICARYIEAICDPLYNKKLPKGFWETKERYSLADELYNLLSLETLTDFAIATRSKDRSLVSSELQKIKTIIIKSPLAKLANYISGCPHDEAIDYLVSGDNISNAINNTIFLTLLAKAENVSRVFRAPAWSLYHDQTHSFGYSLSNIRESLNGGWANFLVREFKCKIPAGKYGIRKFELVDSKENPIIRSADYFVSLMRFYLENLDNEKIMSEQGTKEGVVQTLGPMIRMTGVNFDLPDLHHEMLPIKTGVKILKVMGIIRTAATDSG